MIQVHWKQSRPRPGPGCTLDWLLWEGRLASLSETMANFERHSSPAFFF